MSPPAIRPRPRIANQKAPASMAKIRSAVEVARPRRRDPATADREPGPLLRVAERAPAADHAMVTETVRATAQPPDPPQVHHGGPGNSRQRAARSRRRAAGTGAGTVCVAAAAGEQADPPGEGVDGVTSVEPQSRRVVVCRCRSPTGGRDLVSVRRGNHDHPQQAGHIGDQGGVAQELVAPPAWIARRPDLCCRLPPRRREADRWRRVVPGGP